MAKRLGDGFSIVVLKDTIPSSLTWRSYRMPSGSQNKNKPAPSGDQKQRRIQQILFAILAIIIIASWLLTLVIN
jgi:hypothetical protein